MQPKQARFQIFKSYIPWLITSIVLVFFLRIVETVGVKSNHIVENLLDNELLGGLSDIFVVGTFNICLFVFYFFITKISSKAANCFAGIVFSGFSIAHIALLFYFFQMFIPLDRSLFGYSLQEIVFTVRTSNTNYFIFFVLSLICILLTVFSFKISKKIKVG